jgi:hypothetical protein
MIVTVVCHSPAGLFSAPSELAGECSVDQPQPIGP